MVNDGILRKVEGGEQRAESTKRERESAVVLGRSGNCLSVVVCQEGAGLAWLVGMSE